jgi:predicted RND superfamily exporter protein
MLGSWILRWWRPILAVGLLATVLGVWPASQLQLVNDLPALLPAGSEGAADYRMFLEEFGGLEKVLILVLSRSEEPGDRDASRVMGAAEELAAILASSPEVAAVRSGIDPDDEAFLLQHVVPRMLLLAGDDWQARLATATTDEVMRGRVEGIRAAVLSPFGWAAQPLIEADPLGLTADLLPFQPSASMLSVDPVSMTFLSPTRRASLAVLTPARSEMDPAGGRTLARELEKAFAAVRGTLGEDLAFAAVGGPLYAAHDEAILRKDLQRTLTGSALGCALLVVLALGSLFLPLGIVLPVSAGLVTTSVLLRFGIGSVSSISVGFAAVLVGLGVDYGIHATTRYCQHRNEGCGVAAALDGTIRGAGPGILTSASTTAAAFAVLTVAHVRPIWELGLIVSIGILAILVTTTILGGAALAGLDQGARSRMPSGVVWRALGGVVDAAVRVATRHAGAVLTVTVLLTLVAAWGLTRFHLEADLRALRPSGHPTIEAEALLAEHFPVPLDTTTILVRGRDLFEALDGAARVDTVLRRSLGDAVSITSPTTWLGAPGTVRERLEILSSSPLQAAITRFEQQLDRAGLDPRGMALGLDGLGTLARGRDPGMPPRESWPDWLDELVSMKDGEVLVAVRVRVPQGVWAEGFPADLRRRLGEEVRGVAVASVPVVARELKELTGRDLGRLGVGALLVVFVVVLLSFRGRARLTLLSLTPVLLGSLWSVGLWSLCGYPIDVLGIAVLPIILGIGIDDGLHAVHGTVGVQHRGLAASVRESGRAMVLTTLTTCIGFGSLTVSRLPGLRRGGILVSLGVLACLAATLLVLPALEARRSRRS